MPCCSERAILRPSAAPSCGSTGLRGARTRLLLAHSADPRQHDDCVVGVPQSWAPGCWNQFLSISLLATSLSLRLVFEEGLFGYKFMALAVMLILLAVVRGRIRGRFVAWLALATLAFNPIPGGIAINARWWGEHAAAALPLACIIVVLVLIVRDAVLRRIRWYLVVWFVIATCAFLQWPLWSLDSIRAQLPLWFWQLVLLPTGVVMAVSPLVSAARTAGAGPTVSRHSEKAGRLGSAQSERSTLS